MTEDQLKAIEYKINQPRFTYPSPEQDLYFKARDDCALLLAEVRRLRERINVLEEELYKLPGGILVLQNKNKDSP